MGRIMVPVHNIILVAELLESRRTVCAILIKHSSDRKGGSITIRSNILQQPSGKARGLL